MSTASEKGFSAQGEGIMQVKHVVVRSMYGEWEVALCDTEEEARAAFKETSYLYACQRYTRSDDGDFAPADKYGWMGYNLGWIKDNLFTLAPPKGPNHAVVINDGEGHGVARFDSFDAARTFYNQALDLDAKMGVAQCHRVLDKNGRARWTQFFRQGRMKLSFKDIEERYLNNDVGQDNIYIDDEQGTALTAVVDRLQVSQVSQGLHMAEREVERAGASFAKLLAQANRLGIEASASEFVVSGAGFQRLECVCCLNAAPTHAVIPCGHRCLCAQDAQAILQLAPGDRRCPVCREHCEGVIKVYL